MGGITTLGQVELLFLIFFIFAPARWLQVPPKSKNRFFWFLGVSGTPKIKKWQKSQKFRFFGHLGLPPGHCGQKNEKFFLLRSFLQLPRLRLGPLKGFLSWHGALQGPSTRLVRCFRNVRERGARTPASPSSGGGLRPPLEDGLALLKFGLRIGVPRGPFLVSSTGDVGWTKRWG